MSELHDEQTRRYDLGMSAGRMIRSHVEKRVRGAEARRVSCLTNAQIALLYFPPESPESYHLMGFIEGLRTPEEQRQAEKEAGL